jgi:hypothetical protein
MTLTDINTADRSALRQFISDTLRAAAARIDSGNVTIARLRELTRDWTGWDGMSKLTATASVEELRLAAHAIKERVADMDEESGAPPLPAPPASIEVHDGVDDGVDEDIDEDGNEDGDEFDKLAREAAELAKRMAKAKAKAAAKPAVVADPTLRSDFEAFRHATSIGMDNMASAVASLRSDLQPVLDVLHSAGGAAALPPRIVASVRAATTGDRMLLETLPFFIPGTAQPTIPAVASPPSFGKTYMADEIGRMYDAVFFHPFKDALDEVDSLVGTLMPRSDGTFAVVDGPLVRAMRAAAAGMNTLFIGDEAFNASKKTMEWMLSTLSARFVEFDGKVQRCYVLQTKHSTEAGDFEVLTAPEDKLNILFCGNLRGNPPEAFMSRVTLLRFDYEEKWAEETALARLQHYSSGVFDAASADVKEWASKWAKAMTASRARYSTMELARPLCFRFLIGAVSNVCRMKSSPTLSDLSGYVKKYAPQQLAIQNAATQDTDELSRKTALEIVKDFESVL